MEEYYLVCEDTLEGIFSGIYQASQMKIPSGHLHIQIQGDEEIRLFARYEDCPVKEEYAAKVIRTIQKEFGREAYLALCRALSSREKDKGEAVYKAICCGFGMRDRHRLMENLKDEAVFRVFSLARNVAGEVHAYIEFVRFTENKKGLLISSIAPRNHILPWLMPHFADRLPLENFLIYDEGRNLFGVHPAGQEWFLRKGEREGSFPESFSEKEEAYSELFRLFVRTVGIEERTNQDLQRSMLPLHYRDHMTEFQEDLKQEKEDKKKDLAPKGGRSGFTEA